MSAVQEKALPLIIRNLRDQAEQNALPALRLALELELADGLSQEELPPVLQLDQELKRDFIRQLEEANVPTSTIETKPVDLERGAFFLHRTVSQLLPVAATLNLGPEETDPLQKASTILERGIVGIERVQADPGVNSLSVLTSIPAAKDEELAGLQRQARLVLNLIEEDKTRLKKTKTNLGGL